ncbi:MAG: hypothetical protein BWY54_01001 [Candidatus Dependentiae bacterium ADurb.Bin331]|nr:MAG: hypothetical protein BWY54_01001 [Candidatus Dependentiae bacterium ADurb.Bin331]
MLSMNLTVFSQQTVFTKTGDTLIAFTLEQSKFLLKKVYEVNELKELDSLNRLQLDYCDSVFVSNEQVILDQENIVLNQKEIIELKDYQISKLNEQLEIERKNVRRQKLFKWVAIISGSSLSGFMTWKWATK